MSQYLPSFLEDRISQIPALQLLQNLGWQYLTPAETVALRGGKLKDVLLESVLVDQLHQGARRGLVDAGRLAAVDKAQLGQHPLQGLPRARRGRYQHPLRTRPCQQPFGRRIGFGFAGGRQRALGVGLPGAGGMGMRMAQQGDAEGVGHGWGSAMGTMLRLLRVQLPLSGAGRVMPVDSVALLRALYWMFSEPADCVLSA